MIQNQLLLKNVLAVVLLSLLLFALAIKTLPDIFSSTSLIASSQRSTLAQVESELATERSRSLVLNARLDSLKSVEEKRGTDQTVLTAIRERCDYRQVSLTGFDRVQQGRRSSDNVVSYRLLVEGRFHAMTLLLSDLEALPYNLMIQSFILESKTPGSEMIRGVFLVNIGEI